MSHVILPFLHVDGIEKLCDQHLGPIFQLFIQKRHFLTNKQSSVTQIPSKLIPMYPPMDPILSFLAELHLFSEIVQLEVKS